VRLQQTRSIRRQAVKSTAMRLRPPRCNVRGACLDHSVKDLIRRLTIIYMNTSIVNSRHKSKIITINMSIMNIVCSMSPRRGTNTRAV
jgi:hypothetical protein